MPVFAFTDIEGSTGMWEQYQDAMGPIIARHYKYLEEGVAGHGGRIIKTTGDGIFAIFPDETGEGPSPALECALELQRRFQYETWPVIGELRVRMAFHSGQAEEVAGDYFGPTANRCARIMSLGWGGQILVSETLRKVAQLPHGAEWVDMGLHQVKDLPEPQHIFAVTHASVKLKEFPPLKSLSSRPHNLPSLLPPFVGREPELKALQGLLADPAYRVVTVQGEAGVGKTRLAVQSALSLLKEYKHGAYLVSLDSADTLALRIALSLKMALYRDQDALFQVEEYLKDKQILLILDPADRLGPPQMGALSALLEACPGLKVVACARRRLNLRSEGVLDLRGLDVASGTQLFVQEVQGFKPGFALKPEEQPVFLRLHKALQGLPLGLELAAGWMGQLSLKSLAESLDTDPRFLVSTRPDMPGAHHSLQALFDSTWELLSQAEQQALATLSIFRGGFTQATAQALYQIRPEVMAALVEWRLLDAGDGGRFAMTIRTRCFASDKLAEDLERRDQVQDMHARLYCALLKDRERALSGYDQIAALGELRREFANVQRAWERAVERGWAKELGQAARCVGLFAEMHGLAREWEPRLNRALILWGGTDGRAFVGMSAVESLVAQANLVASLANFAFSLGRSAEALNKMNKALNLFKKAGNKPGTAYALVRLAILMGPEDERRQAALTEASALYQSLEDRNGEAWARRNLGSLVARYGDAVEGKAMVQSSLLVFQELGNQRELAWSLNALGQISLENGQTEEGLKDLRDARDLFQRLGDQENLAWSLNALGQSAIKRGQWAEAKPSIEESLRIFGQIRHFRGRALALRSLCDIYAELGDLDTAFRAVDQIISDAKAAADWSAQASALLQKGHLLARQQKFAEALGVMEEGQAYFVKVDSVPGQVLAQEAQACTCLKQGQGERARSLLGLASQACADASLREAEARLSVRLGDLDFYDNRIDGGESQYLKALKLSRQSKPGDYSLGALLGLAAIQSKQGRYLEALNLILICERSLELMPASDAEYNKDLLVRFAAQRNQVSGKLLRSVIDDARAKLALDEARIQLRDCVEKFGA